MEDCPPRPRPSSILHPLSSLLLLILLVGTASSAAFAAIPATQKAPDIVLLKELVDRYEPVPFDHKSHAAMADMWDGCVTCHHRKPEPATQPVNLPHEKTQDDAGAIPACKQCHAVSSDKADIHLPNLKGAYHRQCLNCHREWANENACNACHKPRDPNHPTVATTGPSVDDIVGRMHPPIPEPDVKIYKTRFTPAVGVNAVFRHKEHTARYGISCASCHRSDNCADCHNGVTRTIAVKPVKPGRTWSDSHAPCMSCHQGDRCGHCHYDNDKPQPPSFEHRSTGQLLDKDHADLKCAQCHPTLRSKITMTCGGADCHARNPSIAFPVHRPGPVVATQPVVTQVAAGHAPSTFPTSAPTTRAVIKRIRR